MTFFQTLQSETARERHALLHLPIIGEALQGRIDLDQYVAFLAQAWHHVRHTAPLLMACGSRLPDRLGWLRAAVADYIEEEIGHDDWILADLAACGADVDAVCRSRPAPATDVMVAYAYHQIDRRNPVGLFGMVHVLEGTSAAIATTAADSMRTALGLPAAAFTYLTSHGSLDQQHVRTFEDLMNRLDDADDRGAVVDCARTFYRLYADVFRFLPARAREAA